MITKTKIALVAALVLTSASAVLAAPRQQDAVRLVGLERDLHRPPRDGRVQARGLRQV